jgi:hypothetical protein
MGDRGYADHGKDQDRRTDCVTGEAFKDTELHATSMCVPHAIVMTVARTNFAVLAAKLAQSVRHHCSASNRLGLKRVCTSSVPFLIADAAVPV